MMRTLVNTVTAALVAASSLAPLVAAHGAEKGHKEDAHKYDERQHKPHHGGIVSIVGHHEFELIAKADSMTLYGTNDEKPVPTKGGTASVTLASGTDKVAVKLEPAGENRFERKGNFKVGGGAKALVTVNLPGKKAEQVRFTLK